MTDHIKNGEITQKRLKKLLSYNKNTGRFTWTEARRYNKNGKIAGTIMQDGYRRIKIDGETYLAHHLVWLYVFGKFHQKEIDHINHARDDNRICNLRDVTMEENKKNRKMNKNNTSDVAGVYWHKEERKWIARIQVNKKRKLLGLFDDINLAKQAREYAKLKYGFHPNHA